MVDLLDSTSLTDRMAQIAAQMFFIVGCERSGTTLLQSMLISEPSIIIPPETQFYAAFPVWKRLYGPLHREKNYAQLMQKIWAVESDWGVETDEAIFRRFALAAPHTRGGLFLALLTAYGYRLDGVRIGEKSPVHTRFVGELLEDFPEARFVHIIRDPRAVVLSLGRLWQRTRSSLGLNIERWRRAFRMHQRFADRLGPRRYCLVRYEELVTNPQTCLRIVGEMLGVELTERALEPHTRQTMGQADMDAPTFRNTLKPVFTDSIEKWRHQMRPSAIALVEHALHEEMTIMGYPLTHARTKMPASRLVISRWAGRTQDALGITNRVIRKILRCQGRNRAD